MKIDINKILCKCIMTLMVIPFFLVNSIGVHADDEFYFVPSYSAMAYQYFANYGFAWDAYESETEYESYAITINSPSYTITNNTSANNRYQCGAANNSAGFNMGCYVVDANGTHQDLNPDWTVPATNMSGTIARQYTFKDTVGNRIPKMVNTNYQRPTTYTYAKSITITNADWYYIGFMSDSLISAANVGWYSSRGGYLDIERVQYYGLYGMHYQVFRFKQRGNTPQNTTYDVYTIDWPFNTSTYVVPIYAGYASTMTDEVANMLGVDTPTETFLKNMSTTITATNNLISTGDSNSQQVSSAAQSANQELNTSVQQINNIETEYNSGLNEALNDINVSSDLVQHTGFTNAALWVSAQFNRLVVGTPLELVVTFSLITGLALVLIGKVRG